MDNLIGDDVDRWPEILADPAAHLHIYGKGEARPGRKMGHVTRVSAARCSSDRPERQSAVGRVPRLHATRAPSMPTP